MRTENKKENDMDAHTDIVDDLTRLPVPMARKLLEDLLKFLGKGWLVSQGKEGSSLVNRIRDAIQAEDEKKGRP
jgi:hypothetical protein